MSEMLAYRAYFLTVSDHIRHVIGFKSADDATAREESGTHVGAIRLCSNRDLRRMAAGAPRRQIANSCVTQELGFQRAQGDLA